MKIGELAAEYERLVNLKKLAAMDDKVRSEQMSRIEEELIEKMAEEGLQNMKTSSGMTLYRRVDKFPSVADGHSKEELIHAMAQSDQFRDLVSPNYNANSLRSRLREIEENGDEIADSVRNLIRISEVDRIGYKS